MCINSQQFVKLYLWPNFPCKLKGDGGNFLPQTTCVCWIRTTILQLTLISGQGHRSNHRHLIAGPLLLVEEGGRSQSKGVDFQKSSGVRDSGRWGGLGPTVGAEVVLLQSPIVQDQQWLAHRWEGGVHPVSLLLHHGSSRHPSITPAAYLPSS